jgi:A/G-specific adenine glycosylase
VDDGARARTIVASVLAWWQVARVERDRLPWRSTSDPWEVLVAETMLAQTTVGRVSQRYPLFLASLPTPGACARTPAGEVVRLWAGLGYYRRALGLHGAARAIVERHGGEVPATLGELLALPGVGPYTARAVLVTAFGAQAAVVDTNVGRVLARAVAGRPLRMPEAQRTADTLVPPGRSRDWNLALMDFGSIVCRSRRPSCSSCPVAREGACAWRGGAAGAAGADEAGTSAACSDMSRGDPADPAAGSAGVPGRQSRFPGSDREGRGRIVRAACDAPVSPADLARVAGWPADVDRAHRVAEALVADGLLVCGAGGELRLP